MQCVPRATSSQPGDNLLKSTEIDKLIYTYGRTGCKDVSKILNNTLRHFVVVFCHTNLCRLCFLLVFLMISTSCLVECKLSSYWWSKYRIHVMTMTWSEFWWYFLLHTVRRNDVNLNKYILTVTVLEHLLHIQVCSCSLWWLCRSSRKSGIPPSALCQFFLSASGTFNSF